MRVRNLSARPSSSSITMRRNTGCPVTGWYCGSVAKRKRAAMFERSCSPVSRPSCVESQLVQGKRARATRQDSCAECHHHKAFYGIRKIRRHARLPAFPRQAPGSFSRLLGRSTQSVASASAEPAFRSCTHAFRHPVPLSLPASIHDRVPFAHEVILAYHTQRIQRVTALNKYTNARAQTKQKTGMYVGR